jgi:hypothetical protein
MTLGNGLLVPQDRRGFGLAMNSGMVRKFLSVACLLAFAGCGPGLQLPDVCQTGQWVIAGAPGAKQVSVSHSYSGAVDTHELQQLGNKIQVHANLKQVTLTAVSGATSFDFVDSFSAVLNGPAGSNLPAVEVARYDRAGQATGTSLVIPGNSTDIVPYVEGGQASTQISFNGEQPSVDTTVQVQACVSASVAYHL